jgi:uncharacterized Tic20 family protein
MKENIGSTLTSEEKMMAALAHFFGALAALFVWALQKDKSRFVKFQALQALCFDFTVMITSGILSFCWVGVVFASSIGPMFRILTNYSSGDVGADVLFLNMHPFVMIGCFVPFNLLFFIIPRMVASISTLNGRDFRYPLIGKWLEGFLGE